MCLVFGDFLIAERRMIIIGHLKKPYSACIRYYESLMPVFNLFIFDFLYEKAYAFLL